MLEAHAYNHAHPGRASAGSAVCLQRCNSSGCNKVNGHLSIMDVAAWMWMGILLGSHLPEPGLGAALCGWHCRAAPRTRPAPPGHAAAPSAPPSSAPAPPANAASRSHGMSTASCAGHSELVIHDVQTWSTRHRASEAKNPGKHLVYEGAQCCCTLSCSSRCPVHLQPLLHICTVFTCHIDFRPSQLQAHQTANRLRGTEWKPHPRRAACQLQARHTASPAARCQDAELALAAGAGTAPALQQCPSPVAAVAAGAATAAAVAVKALHARRASV